MDREKETRYKLIGIRLNKARLRKNITLEEAGNKVGVNKSTVQRWENGNVEKFKIPLLEILADFYCVNTEWLLGHDVPMVKNEYQVTDYKHAFPLLGTVKAGYDYLAQENLIGYVAIDKNLSDPENYFALKVIGDSMQPVLYEDDIVIVHKQNDVESGQVGIVLVDNEEATIKKVIKHNDYVELIAFNSYYPSRKLDKKTKFTIIGKVVEARISKIFE